MNTGNRKSDSNQPEVKAKPHEVYHKLQNGDMNLIASALGVSRNYVGNILTGRYESMGYEIGKKVTKCGVKNVVECAEDLVATKKAFQSKWINIIQSPNHS